MNQIVPGHARAFTWLLLLTVCVAGFKFGSVRQVVGLVLIIVGAFFGDQATHLDQEAHRTPAPTWIERSMQQHKWPHIVFGLALAWLGVYLAVY